MLHICCHLRSRLHFSRPALRLIVLIIVHHLLRTRPRPLSVGFVGPTKKTLICCLHPNGTISSWKWGFQRAWPKIWRRQGSGALPVWVWRFFSPKKCARAMLQWSQILPTCFKTHEQNNWMHSAPSSKLLMGARVERKKVFTLPNFFWTLLQRMYLFIYLFTLFYFIFFHCFSSFHMLHFLVSVARTNSWMFQSLRTRYPETNTWKYSSTDNQLKPGNVEKVFYLQFSELLLCHFRIHEQLLAGWGFPHNLLLATLAKSMEMQLINVLLVWSLVFSHQPFH